MADVDLATLLEPHKNTLKDMSKSLAEGDHAAFIASVAGLVAALATGNPHIALLAPLGQKAVAKAFGNAADAMFKRELAALEAEEERRAFLGQIDEAVEELIGQALVQLVRV